MSSISDILLLLLFFPMGGVVTLTIYYLKSAKPIESLNRLILIDSIILNLYLILFIVIGIVQIDPQRYYLFYFGILSMLYHFYHLLVIPLIGVLLTTLYYIKINSPIRSNALYIILIAKTSIIVVFFVGYIILNWSVPIFQNFYNSIPDFD
ncbi:MAG: hypothetical protein ACFE9S_02305 [Candidatus Hermodarchaeota archaeon]